MQTARHSSTALLILLLQLAIASPALAGVVVRIKIADMAFSPAEVTAKVGDTVEWVNSDFVDHTATAKDGPWDVMIAAGKTATLQLTKAGTFNYFCRFHPNMTGKISVSAN